jgi:hypothetical protein
MAFLKRQERGLAVIPFSVRFPVDVHEKVLEFCLKKRFTLGAGCTYLIEKALAAEDGEVYTPYEEEKK